MPKTFHAKPPEVRKTGESSGIFFRIPVGTADQWARDHYRLFSGTSAVPKSYYEFEEIIRRHEGEVLELGKEYGDRVFLKYPVPEEKEGYQITGLDIEKKYVEYVRT